MEELHLLVIRTLFFNFYNLGPTMIIMTMATVVLITRRECQLRRQVTWSLSVIPTFKLGTKPCVVGATRIAPGKLG